MCSRGTRQRAARGTLISPCLHGHMDVGSVGRERPPGPLIAVININRNIKIWFVSVSIAGPPPPKAKSTHVDVPLPPTGGGRRDARESPRRERGGSGGGVHGWGVRRPWSYHYAVRRAREHTRRTGSPQGGTATPRVSPLCAVVRCAVGAPPDESRAQSGGYYDLASA